MDVKYRGYCPEYHRYISTTLLMSLSMKRSAKCWKVGHISLFSQHHIWMWLYILSLFNATFTRKKSYFSDVCIISYYLLVYEFHVSRENGKKYLKYDVFLNNMKKKLALINSIEPYKLLLENGFCCLREHLSLQPLLLNKIWKLNVH